MKDLRLPSDLAEFLEAGRQLDLDPEQAAPRHLRLRGIGELEPGPVYLNAAEEGHPWGEGDEADPDNDPHLDDDGYYVVPAVDLVASADNYPPQHLLTWIPSRREFGTWDSGHLELLVFPRVSWTEVVADPLKWVNAPWYDAGQWPPGVYVSAWLHGYEWEPGTPPHWR